MRITSGEYEYDFDLLDDGTMDTVVEVMDCDTGQIRMYRYSDTSEYRDPDSGSLNFDRFVGEVVLPNADADDWSVIYRVPEDWR